MGNACLQSVDHPGGVAPKDSSFDPDLIPHLTQRSSVALDTIRPMLAQGDRRQNLELILVMVGEKHERCVIPRAEVRRLCKKHRDFKDKINHVVRELRALNAILLEASPGGSTKWAIVNGELDILQEGAQDTVIRDFNATLADLKAFISASWDYHTPPGAPSTNLFRDTAVKLHMAPPSPDVAATPQHVAKAKSHHSFADELTVMSQSEAQEAEDKPTPPGSPSECQEISEQHKRTTSWGLVAWRPLFRWDAPRDAEAQDPPDVDQLDRELRVLWHSPSSNAMST